VEKRGSHALRCGEPERIRELRDATIAESGRRHVVSMSEKNAFRRCRHIITENGARRVKRPAAGRLPADDMRRMGQIDVLNAARQAIETTFCRKLSEADLWGWGWGAFNAARAARGVIGARLTGGGFWRMHCQTLV